MYWKIRDILKYVWNPNIDLNNEYDLQLLNQMVAQVDELLNSYQGSLSTLNKLLNQLSRQYYQDAISKEKSEHVAQLLMGWYFIIEPIITNYGRVLFSNYTYNKAIRYQTSEINHIYKLDETYEGEIVVYPDKINLPENEKQQLIEAIEKLVKPAKLIFYDETLEEYIVYEPDYDY